MYVPHNLLHPSSCATVVAGRAEPVFRDLSGPLVRIVGHHRLIAERVAVRGCRSHTDALELAVGPAGELGLAAAIFAGNNLGGSALVVDSFASYLQRAKIEAACSSF